MHRWYDGETQQCKDCGWFIVETWEDGKERRICRWFSSVFHATSEGKCESYMTPVGVEQYLRRQDELERKRKRK